MVTVVGVSWSLPVIVVLLPLPQMEICFAEYPLRKPTETSFMIPFARGSTPSRNMRTFKNQRIRSNTRATTYCTRLGTLNLFTIRAEPLVVYGSRRARRTGAPHFESVPLGCH